MEDFRSPLLAALAIWGIAGWSAAPVAAQENSGRIRFTTLSKSTPGGLKSDQVRDLTQDLGGYVWLATDRGLCRFDGWETVEYLHNPNSPNSLSSDQLTAVATTQGVAGPLWIGTSSSGLMRFDQRIGKSIFLRKGGPNSPQLLSDHIAKLAVSNDQYLWIGTDQGLNVLNLATETMVVADGPLGSANISAICPLEKGGLWVGTEAGELHHWNIAEKRFERFWSTSVPITAVAADPKNTTWIATAGMGLFSYSPDHDKAPVPHPGLGKSTVTSLFLDSNGNLWVGTTEGLALYDQGNDSFALFQHMPRQADSLAADQITAIFEDRSRILWIATRTGGTSRFNLDRQWFAHIRHHPDRPERLPHASVRTVAIGHDGNVWLGTEEGLAVWDDASGKFRPAPDLGDSAKTSFSHIGFDREGRLWMGTRGEGLLMRDPAGTLHKYRHDPAQPGSIGHDNVSAVLVDAGGRIFVGTLGGGLFRLDVSTGAFSRIASNSSRELSFVSSLAEDAGGAIWVASQDEILILPAGGERLQPMRSVYPKAAPTSSDRPSTVFADTNGIVWIGTVDAGLDRFNTATGETSNFSHAVHGLPDDHVVALAKDQANLLWVATRSGIARLNAMQNEFRAFGEEDGLQRAGFQPGAVARNAKGRLFFGGLDGFNIIDPAELPALPRTPRAILTSFEYFGEPVVPKKDGILEKEIAATSEIRLAFDRRLIFGFRFANFDYRFPNRGHFRYRLDGFDKDWIVAGDDRKATYANLGPGKYQFRVQSSLDGRDWPDVPASVRVIVTPPWWQTWWARTLALAALVLATVGATRASIRSRMKQLRRREEMLTAQRDKAEAALARQLQHRMLIDRSSRNLLNKDKPDHQLLSGALGQITADFEATHCLVHQILAPGEDTPPSLKQLGYWNASSIDNPVPSLSLDDPFVRRIVEAGAPLVVVSPAAIPSSILGVFPEGMPVCLLAARTSFLDSANGIIVLFRVGEAAPWTDDDAKLLAALIGQFGISIAQIQTAAIEEQYKRHLEEARHSAEIANRAKSDFLAKMTHELRTPLNAIIGFSEILGSDPTLSHRQRDTLDIINNSGEHLLDVINEILDLSKIEAGKMEKNDETFELVPLLKSVHEMLSIKAEEKRIGFNFAARSALPGEIVTDRSKLRQILINLLGNAIKFTAQGAVGVTIGAEMLGSTERTDGRMRRKVRILFEIRDTGRGIREEEIGKLFERYSQTETGRRSSEGTGLGLPIARSFIQLMGGDIEVSSVFGEGTTFRFSIECDEVAAVAIESGAQPAALDEATVKRINGFQSSLGEVRILIAEDQPTNRLLLKRILGKAGFALAEAENGQAAIEKWSEWHPHLILMDEDMPVKKGSEATREIQSLATDANRPVIVSLTAYALDQARLSALESGCSDFVAKPFRSHELFTVIAKHLAVEYTFGDAA